MRKIQTLDGLRGYAILMVIYHHLPHIQGWTIYNRLPSILRVGYLGVDIFFVLSGFLITRILIAEKKKNRFSFKVFYYKRALRIFPAYYLLLIATGIIFTWQDFLPNALYLSNYYYSFNRDSHPLRHLWSLSVEEHFYLVWPLLLYYLPLSKAEKIIKYVLPAIAIVSAIVTVIFLDNKLAEALIYRGTNYRILTLSLGGWLAFKEADIVKLKPVLLAVAALAIMAVYFYLKQPGAVYTLLNLFLLSIVSVLIFLFALNAEKKTNILRTMFTNPVMSYIGRISYGLYLYHFPVFYFFGITINQIDTRPMNWQVIILPLIACFSIATISYFVIEQPFLRLKKKISA